MQTALTIVSGELSMILTGYLLPGSPGGRNEMDPHGSESTTLISRVPLNRGDLNLHLVMMRQGRMMTMKTGTKMMLIATVKARAMTGAVISSPPTSISVTGAGFRYLQDLAL